MVRVEFKKTDACVTPMDFAQADNGFFASVEYFKSTRDRVYLYVVKEHDGDLITAAQAFVAKSPVKGANFVELMVDLDALVKTVTGSEVGEKIVLEFNADDYVQYRAALKRLNGKRVAA